MFDFEDLMFVGNCWVWKEDPENDGFVVTIVKVDYSYLAKIMYRGITFPAIFGDWLSAASWGSQTANNIREIEKMALLDASL